MNAPTLAARTWCAMGLTAALLVHGQASAQVAPPRDERNASFWNRIDNPPPDPMQPPRSWYKPLATVRATPGPFLPQAEAGKTRIAPQVLEQASQFAQANGAQSLIVIHQGVVQLERYYDGTDAGTPFSSHSLVKTLAALLVGAAIADGHIASLDEPASKWLGEWRDSQRDRITLRQLLQMSGGFNTPLNSDPAQRFMQMHYGSDVEAIVRSAPLAYPPGQGWAFDNDNLHPIGLVIERATGMPYQDYLARRLWQGLGAAQAQLLMDREGGRAYMYCCMLSLPRDWARLGQMLLDGGVWQGRRLLPAAFVEELRKPAAANPDFGLQLMLGAAWLNPKINRFLERQRATLPARAPAGLVYLSGAGGQQVAILPAEQLVIVRTGKFAPGWRDATLPVMLHEALMQPAGAASASQAVPMAGAGRP